MTTANTDTCGCDASKAWEARAIRAEADLALAKDLLRRVSIQIGEMLDVLPPDDESEESIDGTWGEVVLASGQVAPAAVGLRSLLVKAD